MSPDWAYPLLTGLVLVCAGRLIWVDMRRFEIETPTLLLMAAGVLTQSVLSETAETVLIRGFAALAFYGSVLLITRHVRGLSRVGAGDPPLIGVAALMVFPNLILWSVLACGLILLTAFSYARARGKPGLRSMFPAAPPLLTAAIITDIYQGLIG